MAGLLDDFSSFIKTPEGQGLLSGAFGYAANAKRGQPINSLGRGGIAGLMGYAGAQDREMQQAEAAKVNEYRTAQLDKMRADMEAQKRAQAEADRVNGVVQQALIGASPTQAISMDAKGPTLEKAQMIGQRAPLDASALIAQRVPLETVKSLFEAQNFGKPKVARTVEGQDEAGNKVTYQLDEFGQRVGDGVQGYTAPVQVDLGGRVQFVRPQPGVTLGKTMTPGEIASNAVARGNLAVSQQRLAVDQRRESDANGKPEFRDGQWVVPPKDMRPGDVRPVTAPTAAKDANEAVALIKQAREILPNATGSYGGAAIDQTARFFGASTDGDKAASKLKVIGGMLTAKMPKMSGPQSDKDVALYREMAGRVGDETLPIALRQAALDTVEEIQMRHTNLGSGDAQQQRQPEARKPAVAELPPASQHKGRTVRDTQTGRTLRSDGMTWKEVQ